MAVTLFPSFKSHSYPWGLRGSSSRLSRDTSRSATPPSFRLGEVPNDSIRDPQCYPAGVDETPKPAPRTVYPHLPLPSTPLRVPCARRKNSAL